MASFTICDEHSARDIQNRLSQIYTVIEKYRCIIEAYLSDFYTKDHWSLLPLSWQHYLEQLEFSHLSKLLTGQPWCQPTLHSSVCPLSLLALRACCDHLSLNRRCVDMDSPHTLACVERVLCSSTNDSSSSNTLHGSLVFAETSAGTTLSFKNGQLMDMQHIFRKHVKPKKQHEIQQLGKVISLVSQHAATGHIVDVGAGLGHLSRLLTFAYGLKVTTVEASGGQAPKASEFDRELEKDVQKKLKKNEQTTSVLSTPADLPSHVVCTVQPDITTDDFLRLVFSKESRTEDSTSRSILPNSSADMMSAWQGNQADSAESVELEQLRTVNTVQDGVVRNLESVEDWNVPQMAGVKSADALSVGNTDISLSCMEDMLFVSNDAGQCSGESAAKISEYDPDKNDDIRTEDNHKSVEIKLQNSHTPTSGSGSPTDKSIPSTQRNESKVNLPVNQTNDTIKTVQEEPQNKRIARSDQIHHPSGRSMNESSEEKLTSDGDDVNIDKGCDMTDRLEKGQRADRFVLAGLHACGDLTATLLRVFVNCPAVSALVSVACCYRKLSAFSCDDDKHSEKGYPMSQFVRSLQSHPLTYEAREMACHFVDAYAQRLIDGPPHLKIHSYRAAVQYVVTQTRPDFALGLTRLVVKRGAEIPFPQYAEQCLQRLGIDPAEVRSATMATAESLTSAWRQAVAFYTLRLSLAPLVETAMLLDRMLYLHEQGLHSVLLPVFDSSLSPRNFALLCCKPPSPACL